MWIALLIVCFAGGTSPLPAQTAKLYVSSKAGDRITAKPDVQFAGAKAGGSTFQINDAVKFQKIHEFGASIMEAGMVVLNSLPADKKEDVLRSLFDVKTGAGFTAMKTPLGGTDFQSAGPWFTYDDTTGDVELTHFSVDRDFGPNGVGTYSLRARKYGNFALQAPIDYPPDWMLYNVNTHQSVQPKYYPVLAKYFIKYLEEYKKHGIVVETILFNDPEVYTKISYPEINVLIRDFVGPALQRSGLTTKLMMSEAPERIVAYERYHEVLDDPSTRKFISAVAYHSYDFKNYDKIAELERKYSEFPFWMDELCYAYEASYPTNKMFPIYEFDDGNNWGNAAENKDVNLEFKGKSLHITAPAISIATVTW